MLTLLMWFIIIIIGVLVVAISTPVTISGHVVTEPRVNIRLRVGLFNGLIKNIPIRDDDKRRKKKAKKKHSKDKPQGGWPRPSLRQISGLVRGLLKCIHFEYLTAEIKFGFGDPADTGFIFGLMCPVIYARGYSSRISLNAQPVFGSSTFSGEAKFEFSTIPITLVLPVARFAWRLSSNKQRS